MRLFQKYGVNAIFAGHLHNNAYGKVGNMEMITIGPVGKVLDRVSRDESCESISGSVYQ